MCPLPTQTTEGWSQLVIVDITRQKILFAFLEPETAGYKSGWCVKVHHEARAANTHRNYSWKLVNLFFAFEYFNDLQTVNLIGEKEAEFVTFRRGRVSWLRPNPGTQYYWKRDSFLALQNNRRRGECFSIMIFMNAKIKCTGNFIYT